MLLSSAESNMVIVGILKTGNVERLAVYDFGRKGDVQRFLHGYDMDNGYICGAYASKASIFAFVKEVRMRYARGDFDDIEVETPLEHPTKSEEIRKLEREIRKLEKEIRAEDRRRTMEAVA